MQAGRLVSKALVTESLTGEDDLANEVVGHTPANKRFAARLMRSIARRQAREAAATCAAIAPRDERGRFA